MQPTPFAAPAILYPPRMREHFDHDTFRDVIVRYSAVLGEHAEEIDRLNVFPVPDADTGTNMHLTVRGVVSALDGVPADLPGLCAAVKRASLIAATGNSGIIFSQWLHGFCGALDGLAAAGPDDLRRALHLAADAAYASVVEPREGTILTVARGAAEAAAGTSCQEVLSSAAAGARAALARTPDLLPVLREAGVVDSGGKGLAILFDVAAGVEVAPPVSTAPGPAAGHMDFYEVVFLLDADDVTALIERWRTIGDSITVSGDAGTWSCHVHTHDVGGAVEAALDLGRPRRIKVTPLPGEG